MRPMEQVVQDGAREIYQVEQSAVVEKPVYQAVKRLFDVVVSALALLILGIPMLLLMPVIRADSPGPAIFRQERLGKDGKPFVIYLSFINTAPCRWMQSGTDLSGRAFTMSAVPSWAACCGAGILMSCPSW